MSDQDNHGGVKEFQKSTGTQDTGGLKVPTSAPEEEGQLDDYTSLDEHRLSPSLDHPRGSVKQFHLEPQVAQFIASLRGMVSFDGTTITINANLVVTGTINKQ